MRPIMSHQIGNCHDLAKLIDERGGDKYVGANIGELTKRMGGCKMKVITLPWVLRKWADIAAGAMDDDSDSSESGFVRPGGGR